MNTVSVTATIVLFAAAFVATVLGVGLFTRLGRRRGFFDVPNDRSSHSTPTPRGGGFHVMVCLNHLSAVSGFRAAHILGILTSGFTCRVYWLDALYSVPFWGRLIFHIAAAGIFINDVGYWPTLFVPLISTDIPLGNVFGLVLTVTWLVWLLNAYNFMDGIDGIAGLQAVVACVAWAILAYVSNLPATFLLSGIVASAAAGFLIQLSAARIFMSCRECGPRLTCQRCLCSPEH